MNETNTTMMGALPGMNDPAAAQYGFGGGPQDPYLQMLMKRRMMAQALEQQQGDRTPMTHWTQVLGSIANKGVNAWRENDAEQRILDYAKGQREDTNSLVNSVLGRFFGPTAGGGQAAPAPVAPAPSPATEASPSGNAQDFIRQHAPLAQKVSQETGLDPRLVLAQAGLETGWGAKAPGNNFFGIKGEGQTLPTTEVVNGQSVPQQANFRAYGSPEESFTDYAKFIRENPRYAPVMQGRTLDDQVRAMGASGYATDPAYGQKLMMLARGVQLPDAGAVPAAQAMPQAPPGAAASPPIAGAPPMTQAQRMQLAAGILQMRGASDPRMTAIAGGLRSMAGAFPDTKWQTTEVGGQIVAYDPANPSRRQVLGPASSHTPLPESVISSRRAVNAPFPEVARSPERMAQDRDLLPPTIVNEGQAVLPRGSNTPSYIAPRKPEAPPPGYRFGEPTAPGGPPSLRPIPGSDAETDRARTLRSEYTKLTDPFRVTQDAYQKITSAAANPTGAGDMSLIFGYMKLLDPGSTVREGEYATAANAGSVPERVLGMYNKAINGERLADTVRSDFVEQARGVFGVHERGYRQLQSQYEQLARLSHVNPALVLPDFTNPRTSQPAGPRTPTEVGQEQDDMDSRLHSTMSPTGPRSATPTRRVDPNNPLGLLLPGVR